MFFEVTKFQNIQIVSPFYVWISGNKGGKLLMGGKITRGRSMTTCN